MVTRSTRRGIILMAVLCVGSYMLSRDRNDNNSRPIEGLDFRLNYALEDFTMRAFDENGMPLFNMQAPRLTNEAATSIGRVENPRLEIRQEEFVWHIIADAATVSDDQQHVVLSGSVSLTRRNENDTEPLLIDSSDVSLAVNDKVATSDQAVRIEDLSGVLEAQGFKVDMIKNEFQLNNNVQGIYAIP